MSRHPAKSLALLCFVVIQSSIVIVGRPKDQVITRIAGDWLYSDPGGTIRYSISADKRYRSHSVMTAPGYPHFTIDASGIYSVSAENVTITPQSAKSQGEPAKLITVIGRYDTATDQLLLMPEGGAAFKIFRRVTKREQLTTPMAQSSTLSGVLLVGLLAGGVITLVASSAILWLYKRAVRKALQKDAPEKLSATDFEVQISGHKYLRSWQNANPPMLLDAQARARRLGAVYSVAGLSAVLVWTAALLLEAQAYAVKPALAFFIIFAWAAVICWNQVTGWSFKARRHNDLYHAATLAMLIVAFWLGFASSLRELAIAFLLANLIPTLLTFAFSAPSLRSIGPCILALSTTCAVGTWATVHHVNENVSALLLLSHLRERLNISALQSVELLMVAAVVIFLSIGWLFIWLVARGYKFQRSSDQSIQIDSFWLIWSVVEAIFISWRFAGSGKGAYLALFGFPIYWVVRKIGFAWLKRREKANDPGMSLLYLRRFALNRKTDRLFRATSLLWRFVGDVRLLGGSDLAGSTIQPQTLLNFISFLGIGVYCSLEKLGERVRDLPGAPDPDTRLRVSEFLCSNGIWQGAVLEQIKHCDFVLADFRGFNPQNQGSRIEIEMLLNSKSVDQVLIVTDTAAARDYLAAAITDCWPKMPADSPNYHVRPETARIILQVNQEADPLPVLRVLFSFRQLQSAWAAAAAAD